jgi:integrase
VSGLVLRVNHGGRKVWQAIHYVKVPDPKAGKMKTVPRYRALGRYPDMGLLDARVAAKKFLGDNPNGTVEQDVKRDGGDTFRAVAGEFLTRHVDATGLRSKSEIVRCLDRYIHPRWADRAFADIRRGDVSKLLDEIVDNHGARQADVCLAIIGKMCNWYQTRNGDYVSPVVRGMNRTRAADRKRQRFLTDDEIRRVWTACDGAGTFGALVKVLLLTGQRREKVVTMRWDDVVDGVWTIPTAPREKTNVRVVALPPMALKIIGAQPRIDENPHLFAAGVGTGPFNSFSQRKDELDVALPGMDPWVLHDLRRTCRKLMTRAGVRPDVAELALGHSIKGIQAVYDDRAEYRPLIEQALQSVADEVSRIVNQPTRERRSRSSH